MTEDSSTIRAQQEVHRAHTSPRHGSGPSRWVVSVAWVLVAITVAYTAYRWLDYLATVDIAGTIDAWSGRDFRAFSVAGSLARSGDASLLYAPGSLPYTATNAAAFVYAPWFAVAMIPFTAMTFQTGYWVWLALTGALAAWAMWMSGRRVGLAAIAILALLAPGLQTILFGQSAFVMVAGAAMLAWAVARRRHGAAGLAAAMMSFKPHLLIGLGVVWLWQRGAARRSIATAIGAAVTLALTAEVMVRGAHQAWVSSIVADSSQLLTPNADITLGAALELLVGPALSGMLVRFALLAIGVVWLTSVLMRKSLDDGAMLLAAFGMVVSFGLRALLYDVMLLAPALVMVYMARRELRKRIIVYSAATLSFLTLGPVLVAAQIGAIGRALALGPIALAALVIWLVEASDDASTPVDGDSRRIAELRGR